MEVRRVWIEAAVSVPDARDFHLLRLVAVGVSFQLWLRIAGCVDTTWFPCDRTIAVVLWQRRPRPGAALLGVLVPPAGIAILLVGGCSSHGVVLPIVPAGRGPNGWPLTLWPVPLQFVGSLRPALCAVRPGAAARCSFPTIGYCRSGWPPTGAPVRPAVFPDLHVCRFRPAHACGHWRFGCADQLFGVPTQ